MKAVVLAGGYATRLWPITKNRPKMFLPVGGSTVIDRILADLESDDRISEVFVSTNERFAGAFEAHLADSEFEKPTLSVEETTDEDEKFGVVGALAQLVEREGIDNDLLVIAGDNLISFGVEKFLDTFEAKEAPTIAAYDIGSREKATSYGIVELEGDRVVDFQEKPDDPTSTLVSIACYAFPGESVSLLAEYLSGDNNPDEPGWFIQWLQAHEPTYAFTFEGAWFDIGTPESYLEAVRWHLEGDSIVADTASVEAGSIGDDVHVMDGAVVEGSRLESSIIFPEATIRDADVRRSIVDEGTVVEGLDLAGALIGAHTTVTADD